MPKSSDVIVPIAVVGCGYWGVNYLRLLSELPHAVLAGVCGQNRDRVDEVARRFHVATAWKGLDPVLADPAVQAVVVATPPSAPAGLVRRVLHPQKEDVAFVTLTYPNGVVGNIQISWIDSNKVREVVVVGSRQRIVFDDVNNLEKIRIFEKGAAISGDVNSFGEFQLQLRDGDILSPKIEATEPLRNQCEHFVECVVSGREPLTGGGA